MQFLITAIVAVILLVGVAASCPGVCSCTSDLNGVHVNAAKVKRWVPLVEQELLILPEYLDSPQIFSFTCFVL
jgi:uncharacterized membrane protein HdeD (DUF308 family)